MRFLAFGVVLFFSYFSFCQQDNNSNYDVHYVIDAASSPEFFTKISNENTIDRIFLSTCFYYVELYKENKVFVDTFDLLSPQNYALLISVLNKQTNVFGYTKSSYLVPYFKLYADSTRLSAMNKILDSVKFINKDYLLPESEGIKRLHSLIESEDSILVNEFLSYLLDSIITNKTLLDIHKSMLLDANYICNSVFGKSQARGSDLIIDFSFYEDIIYGKPKLSLWCSNYFEGNICFHINLSKSKGVKSGKLKKAIRKHFNLKRRDIRRGGNFKMPNGNDLRLYQ